MDILWIGISVILLIVLIVLWSKLLSLKKSKEVENALLSKKNHSLLQEISSLQMRVRELSVYEGAFDADKEALGRLESAKEQSEFLITEAQEKVDSIIMEANQKAEEIIEKTNKELEDVTEQINIIKKGNRDLIQKAKEEAEKVREDASRHSVLMISEAEKKAKDIAGEAYDIANKAKYYEEVAKAMKNVIEGYGDEYLKPTFSLLDDLADEFGYDEAGQRLKDARERTRMLVKNGDAASCDYVEKNRKETALNFVLDAFNGKVDTILSMIKKDNYGVLERKIKDSP